MFIMTTERTFCCFLLFLDVCKYQLAGLRAAVWTCCLLDQNPRCSDECEEAAIDLWAADGTALHTFNGWCRHLVSHAFCVFQFPFSSGSTSQSTGSLRGRKRAAFLNIHCSLLQSAYTSTSHIQAEPLSNFRTVCFQKRFAKKVFRAEKPFFVLFFYHNV